MKFPTCEEMGQKVAEQALDSVLINDKTLREWIHILSDELSILEKIRAEIEQNAYPIVHGVNNHEKGMTLYGILQIIDKYREDGD